MFAICGYGSWSVAKNSTVALRKVLLERMVIILPSRVLNAPEFGPVDSVLQKGDKAVKHILPDQLPLAPKLTPDGAIDRYVFEGSNLFYISLLKVLITLN
jgi:hypothetical protein